MSNESRPLDGAAVAGIGIDAVDVGRFRSVLNRRPSLAARVFTEAERADAASRGDPAEHLAARFAAKEAVMKALGTGIGGFAFKDVEVLRASGEGATRGAPTLRLSDRAATVAQMRGVAAWHLSLTHTGAVAFAMVLAEASSPTSA